MKLVRIFSVVAIVVGLLMTTAMAGGPELKPYGFVKGDMVFATKNVMSFAKDNLNAPQIVDPADTSDTAALGFTAIHTRFGLKGMTGDEYKVGGRIEMDFWHTNGFSTNSNPRVRLAYASLAKNNWELRFGQQWDLFSPLNPTTQQTNANMWYQGNRGFRRGQVQFHYNFSGGEVKPKLQLSIGEGAKEANGMLGADNYALMPMFQGRFALDFPAFDATHTIGAFFAYAAFDPDPEIDDDELNTTGFGADFVLNLAPKFSLKGEFSTGTNLNNAHLFTIAPSGYSFQTASGWDTADMDCMGFWGNAVIKANEKVDLVLGAGMDKNNTDNLAAGTLETNMAIYGDVIFKIANGFSLAVEVESISSDYVGADSEQAIVMDVAGKVVF